MPQIAAKRIEQLQLDGAKPLIICDVDEVVVQFLAGFEAFLDARGLWLDAASFALSGNIRRQSDGQHVNRDMPDRLIREFFDLHTMDLLPVRGAVQSLQRLSRHCQIVMLTNLAHEYYQQRRANLDRHNMPYPLITNQGPKGPAVKKLVEGIEREIFFIDDIPHYHRSVAESAPEVHLVHFIADERFARHAPPVENVALKTADWRQVEAFIMTLTGDDGHEQ